MVAGGWVLALLLAAQAAPVAGVEPLVDQVGAVVAVGPSARIVTLAPDVTELVFALGAGERVVAVAPHCDFPAAAAGRPRVQPGDAESVLAAAPDLVLASTAGNDPTVVQRLRSARVRVATLDVTSCARLVEACHLLGALLGREADADTLAESTARRCASAAQRAGRLPSRRALYVVWWDPLIVAAPGTFHDDLLRLAGLVNRAPAGAGRYPRLDPETLLDPTLDLVVAPDEGENRPLFAKLLTRPAGLRLARGSLPVLWVPADPASRPGPRLPLALEALLAAREANP